MRILITENQIHLLRLLGQFIEIVEDQIEGYKVNLEFAWWCKVYDEDSFTTNLIDRSIEELIDRNWDFFHDDTDKGGATMDLELIDDYAREHYTEQIIDVFRRKCGSSLNESKINFVRRLPALEEELNRQLKRVDPTKFDFFQRYIEYLAKVTLMYLPDNILNRDIRGENYDLYTEFRDYIIYGLRNDIRDIYDSRKPSSLF